MRKSNKSEADSKRQNSSTSSNSSNNGKTLKASTYRWVGKGQLQPDGTVVYSALEVNVAGRKSLICCGDSALLSSSNGEELDDIAVNSPVSEFTATKVSEKSIQDEDEQALAEDEEESNYGSHTDQDFRSVCALDPFVAVIVKMWEVPALGRVKGKRRSILDDDVFDNERKVRMKVRAQWYFKKEDVAGMNGWFQGMSKKALLSSMGPRDLVLSEHSDDNEVPTILGRCRVARRRPLVKSSKDVPFVDEGIPKGVYVCRYDVRIPSKGEVGFGYVVVVPYKGEPFDDEVLEQRLSKPALLSSQQKKAAKQTTDSASDALQKGKRKRGESCASDASQQQQRASSVTSVVPDIETDNNLSCDPTSENAIFQPLKEATRPIKDAIELETQTEVTSPRIMMLISNKEVSGNGSKNSSGSISSSHTSSVAEQTGSLSVSSSYSSDDEDDDEDSEDGVMKLSDTENFLPCSPRKQTGIIHVGENHQAFVPPLSTLQSPSVYITRSMTTQCWIPGKISADDLKKYLSESRKILKSFVESQAGGYTFEPEISCIPPCSLLDTDRPAPRGATFLRKTLARECNGDELFDEVHRNDYRLPAALAVVAKAPKKFLTLWDASEREKFELGFQQRCGVLRSIAKTITTKDTKDVVDYHYRFKIPEQFRKYEEQKLKQARRMMATADLRLMDNIVAGGKGGSYVKKNRNWTNFGAAEQRRVLAKEFLVQTRDIVGPERYLLLANNLKLYHEKQLDISQLRENILNVLKDRPELVERFNEFLPKKLRTVS